MGKDLLKLPQQTFRLDQFIAAEDLKKLSQEFLLEKLKKNGQIGVIFNNQPKVAMLEMDLFMNLMEYVENLEAKLADPKHTGLVQDCEDLLEEQDLRKIMEQELISTNEVCKMLNITNARLCKIDELKVVIRGFYLRSEVDAYISNEAANKRRDKFLGKKYKAEKNL